MSDYPSSLMCFMFLSKTSVASQVVWSNVWKCSVLMHRTVIARMFRTHDCGLNWSIAGLEKCTNYCAVGCMGRTRLWLWACYGWMVQWSAQGIKLQIRSWYIVYQFFANNSLNFSLVLAWIIYIDIYLLQCASCTMNCASLVFIKVLRQIFC